MHLDQTLGESVRDEHRFLQYCRSLERALSDASLFGSLNYDPDGAPAHIFAGDLRAVADYLVHGDDQRCIRFSEFLPAALETLPLDSAGPIELVSDLDGSGDLARFKLLRLAAVYAACIPSWANLVSPSEMSTISHQHSRSVIDSPIPMPPSSRGSKRSDVRSGSLRNTSRASPESRDSAENPPPTLRISASPQAQSVDINVCQASIPPGHG